MSVGPANQISDDMLLQISVEDALSSLESLSLDEFVA